MGSCRHGVVLKRAAVAGTLFSRMAFGFLSLSGHVRLQPSKPSKPSNPWTAKSDVRFAEVAGVGVVASGGALEDTMNPDFVVESSVSAPSMRMKDVEYVQASSASRAQPASSERPLQPHVPETNAQTASALENTQEAASPKGISVGASSPEAGVAGAGFNGIVDMVSFKETPESEIRATSSRSDEGTPEAAERKEIPGKAFRRSSAVGGTKEPGEVDDAESEKLESMALDDKSAPEPANATINIRKASKAVAAPETRAAEKVLTLLDLGLVDKEEVNAYYDALSNLERTTRETKQAVVADASKPTLSSDREKSAATRALQGAPLEFVPFPTVCAVLGAAGVHSLQLPGHLSTVASTIGAIAGGAVGLLIVARDDVLGGAVRTVGSIAVESAGTAGMLVGRKFSDTAESTLSMVVAAAVDVVIKAPSKAAGGLASSMSDSASSAIESVASLPRKLANKSVDGVKDALQGSSQAAIGISGGLARQAAGAAGDALLNTSKAAIIAVKGSPKDAVKQLRKEATTGHEEPHVSFVKGEKHAKRNEETMSPGTPGRGGPGAEATLREEADEKAQAVSVKELEAKMASVQEALERFDTVKARIETAQTSGSLLETVGMAKRQHATPDTGMDEAASKPTTAPVGARNEEPERENRESTPRFSSSSAATKTPKVKPIDEVQRKQVAEQLLERASQRATEAKKGLRKAAAKARREMKDTGGAVPNRAVEKAAPKIVADTISR